MDNTILSICIPLHNRSETAIGHVEELLKCDNPKFDIVISDTSDDGKDFLSSWRKTDPRVSVARFPADTPPEENWRIALESADGVFAMHLNDRDFILKERLPDLLDFLEDHSDFSGGICKYISVNPEPLIFKGRNEALMGVPYFASHTTGTIFNTDELKEVGDLEYIFSRENGTHPHDILLGRLSQKGKMFIYTKEVWGYASPEFYKNNLSGFSSKRTGLFFEPKERLFELKKTIEDLQKLDFTNEIKKYKITQMYKTYLGLSTNGYFYVMESDYESAHYGLTPEKFGIIKRYRFSMDILNIYASEFQFSKEEKKMYKKWLAKTIMIPVIARHTSKINNPAIRNMLRKMRMKRESGDSAVLR